MSTIRHITCLFLILFSGLTPLTLLATANTSTPPKPLSWNLNDVSYLYPLPKSPAETTEDLLKPLDTGAHGALLPSAVFEMIPTLNNGGNGQAAAFNHELKVVGVRIDPCPNSTLPAECSPEVRLVWQLINIDQDTQQWSTQDATLHTFYHIEKPEFESLKQKLMALKVENLKNQVDTALVPLGVHPGFLNPQSRNTFRRTLNRLLTSHCGEQNLYKVTFMRLLTANVWWRFGGIVKENGAWTAVKIPRLTITFQDIFNSAAEAKTTVNFPGKEMDAIFNILPDTYPTEDDLTPVINDGYRTNDVRDANEFKQKISALERFQNPKRTNPSNLDCASCHFSDSTRYYINTRFPDLSTWKTNFSYANPNINIFRLDNETIVPQATRVIRAFGYFGDQPAITQRTINDSAESAHWLNQHN